MPKYKLTYFNNRARVEYIRILLAHAGVEWEDHRINFGEWGTLKPKTPWCGLPTLEVDGQVYGQSLAIARFLARELGLAGKTSTDQMLADSIVDGALEAMTDILSWIILRDEAKKAEARKNFDTVLLPRVLGNIQRILKSNNEGKGYLVGDSVTWADIYLFGLYDTLTVTLGYQEPFREYPEVEALAKRVKELPNIKKWLEERPKSPF